MRKKIYLHLSGGIGNQLFQYAAAKNLSIINNAELILDKTTGFITDLKFKRKGYRPQGIRPRLSKKETIKNYIQILFIINLMKILIVTGKLMVFIENI